MPLVKIRGVQEMLVTRACAVLSVALVFTLPCAAAWPDKPITIIVGAAPGGTGDQAARIISEKLGAELGTTVVVENKAGAGGILGSQYVARTAPDGYTIMMANIGSHSINYSLYKKLPYTPEDFSAITLVISNPNILVVNSSTPFTTVQELSPQSKRILAFTPLGRQAPDNLRTCQARCLCSEQAFRCHIFLIRVRVLQRAPYSATSSPL